MTHVFVSPHPDDIALSCGGLVASLRELGQSVTILTVFSGTGSSGGAGLTEYQRRALGFGTKANWPNSQAFRRTNIGADYPVEVGAGGSAPWMADVDRVDVTQTYANTQARQFWQRAAWTRSANITNEEADERPVADSIGGQGSLEVVDFGALDAMETRKMEEERYAWFIGGSVIFLDLPDAVYRGYEGDEQLLGEVRDDDPPPYELLRSEILRLEPQMVYFPLGVGGHVDHQLCREVGLSLLAEKPALGHARPVVRRGDDVLRGLPVRVVERLRGPRRGSRGRVAHLVACGRRARGSIRRHHRCHGPQGRRHPGLRITAADPVRVRSGA